MKHLTKERIYPTKEELLCAQDAIRLSDHIKRYQSIKRYCYGTVVDAACGVGYGSYLLSDNPDIKRIVGIDISQDAIDHARKEFTTGKTTFMPCAIGDLDIPCDTLVSIETIEHIDDLDVYAAAVGRCNPSILIVSFPEKKSTHFNEFHHHDLKRQDVVDLFPRYCLVRELNANDVSTLVFAAVDAKMPSHIFR